MSTASPPNPFLERLQHVYVAVVSDALDALDLRHQVMAAARTAALSRGADRGSRSSDPLPTGRADSLAGGVSFHGN